MSHDEWIFTCESSDSYKLLLTVKILSLQKKKFIFSSKENTMHTFIVCNKPNTFEL